MAIHAFEGIPIPPMAYWVRKYSAEGISQSVRVRETTTARAMKAGIAMVKSSAQKYGAVAIEANRTGGKFASQVHRWRFRIQ